MDITQSKLKAKVLSTYLKEIRTPIKHGQALDAMARINGHRSWNEFSAAPAEATSPAAEATSGSFRMLPVLSIERKGVRVPLEASARVRTDDHRAKAEFDAVAWLAQASNKELADLVEIGFGGDYVSDDVGEFTSGHDAEVKAVFDYLARARDFSDLGFEVDVEPEGVWAYLRAFRYPLYVRITLVRHYGSLGAAFGQIGTKWAPSRLLPIEVAHEEMDLAWSHLGGALEEGLAKVLGIEMLRTDVAPMSGRQEATVPATLPAFAGRFVEEGGQHLVLDSAALSKSDLRRITEDGSYPLDVVLGVELEDIAGGIDALNDTVSERIAGGICELTDIGYYGYAGADVAQLAQKWGAVIRVRAYWTPMEGIDDDEDDGSAH